jgi:hypothetical protein
LKAVPTKTKAQLERALLSAVQRLDEATTTTVMNADGTLSQSRPLGDRMEMRGTVTASGQAKKPPKTLDAYLNADAVKPFIGTKVDPNNLPPGYQYGKIPTGTDKAGNETFREVVYPGFLTRG